MPKSGRHPDKKLTAVAIRNLSKPGRYADGGGLYVVVDPSGAKRWVQRLVIQGKRRDLGLGGLTTVTLAEAREKALEARRSARSGGDPLAARRAAQRHVPTFAEAMAPAHAEQRKTWKNAKHADQWVNTLTTYALPILGAMRIDRVETSDIMRVLTPIWTEKPETARRVRQRISAVFEWAKVHGYRSGENPVAGVQSGLARQPKAKSNHAALAFTDMPAFMLSLEGSGSNEVAKLAFQFLILTVARTSEVLGATWSEIDFAAAAWTIPADRMKAGREHRVPLSPPAIETLLRLREINTTREWLFPGQNPTKPLSGMVFLMMLRRMAVPVTGHGFRSTFTDWASETTSFPNDVREMALAHAIKNKVEAAYRRGDFFEKRRALMNAWSEYVFGA